MAARGRALSDLRDDARKRADVEALDDRHPDADITRYLNQGGAALRDLLIEARGRSYFRKPVPQTITTTSATRYNLNSDFLRLISVRLAGPGGDTLEPFAPQDEPFLREPGVTCAYPTHYELQQSTIELLPVTSGGRTVIVEYVASFTDLVADGDVLEGYDGWEDYVVDYAALFLCNKDDEAGTYARIERAMQKMEIRISKLASKRDAFRSGRVQNVRGARLVGRWR